MENDLIAVVAERAEQTLSSPALRRLLAVPLGTVQHPGQRARKYLAGGSKLTAEQRADAERMRYRLQAALDSAKHDGANNARLAIIAKLLVGYPIAGASEKAGQARGELYLDALDDMPPFALQEALTAWGKGEGDGNHDFAPSPARLRGLAQRVVDRHRGVIARLDDLLNAQTLDEAMDSTREPAPATVLIPVLRRV